MQFEFMPMKCASNRSLLNCIVVRKRSLSQQSIETVSSEEVSSFGREPTDKDDRPSLRAELPLSLPPFTILL